MEPLFEHRMEFAGIETRVLELEGRGTPVVLFHGWSDSADTWRHALALLAREGRRAIAVDLPGFGTADDVAAGPLLPQLDAFGAAAVAYATAEVGRRRRSRAAAARTRARARGAAPGRRVILAGNSLGGCLALRLAARGVVRGATVERVVALAPAGLDMAGWFRLVEHDPIVRSLLALPLPLPRRAVREVVGRVYSTLAFAHPELVEPGVVQAFTHHHPNRAAVARLLASGRRLLPELKEAPFELDAIACPVLLIWGDRDRMVYARGAERVLEQVADARLELLEDCGHCPQIEQPERVVELLLDRAQRSVRAA